MKRYIASRDAGEPAWGRAVGAGMARTYESLSVSAMAARLAGAGPEGRRVHELFPPGVPCSPFADIDAKAGATEAEADAWAASFAAETLAALGLPAGYPAGAQVFSCSRPGKVSRHVVLSGVVLGSMAEMRELAGRLPCVRDNPAFDRGVYKEWGSLRAPFCTAMGSDGRLKPGVGGAAFDAAAFARGLVMRLHSPLPVTPLPPAASLADGVRGVTVVRSSSGQGRGRGRKRHTGRAEAEVEALALRIRERVCAADPGLEVVRSEAREGEGGLEFVTRGGRCPFKGGAHASNHGYLHVRLPPRPSPGFTAPPPVAVAHAVCTDADCGGMRWFFAGIPLT